MTAETFCSLLLQKEKHLLLVLLSPVFLNSFSVMCHRKTGRTIFDFKVSIHCSINHSAEHKWFSCLSPNSGMPAVCLHQVLENWLTAVAKIPTVLTVLHQHSFPKYFWIPGWTRNLFPDPPKATVLQYARLPLLVTIRVITTTSLWSLRDEALNCKLVAHFVHSSCLETERWIGRDIGNVPYKEKHFTFC